MNNFTWRNIGISIVSMLIASMLFFCIFLLRNTDAQELSFSAGEHTIDITIQEDGTSVFSITKELINSDASQVIGGYDYAFAAPSPDNVSVTLNDVPVSVATFRANQFDDHILVIDFNESVIRPGETGVLRITATVDTFVQQRDDTQFVRLALSGDVVDEISITYPASFGTPQVVSDKQSSVDENKIVLADPKDMTIIWGESYSIDVAMQVRIPAQEQATTLLSLPLGTTQQQSRYFSLDGAAFGLKHTRTQNQYAAITAQLQEQTFQANMRITRSAGNLTDYKHTSFNASIIPSESITDYFGTFNLDPYAAIDNPVSFLRQYHDTLLNNFTVVAQNTRSQDALSDTSRVFASEQLSSFEACTILGRVGEFQGIQTSLFYGFIAVPDTYGDVLSPHVWCVFSSGNDVFLADPYFESRTGYRYFGNTTDFDRLVFGTLSEVGSFDTALGLLSPGQALITLGVRSFAHDTNDSAFDTVTLSLSDSLTVPIGAFESVSFIANQSSVFTIPLHNLRADKAVFESHWGEDFAYVLLPLIQNRLEYYVAADSLLSFGSQDVSVTLESEDAEVLGEFTFSATFVFNTDILFGLGILALGGVIGMVLFVLRRRQIA